MQSGDMQGGGEAGTGREGVGSDVCNWAHLCQGEAHQLKQLLGLCRLLSPH